MAEIKLYTATDIEDDFELDIKLTEQMGDLVDTMSDNELEIANKIADTLEEVEYPVNLFNEKSVDELNEIFGGHDDMVITENVRAYLNDLRLFDEINNEC